MEDFKEFAEDNIFIEKAEVIYDLYEFDLDGDGHLQSEYQIESQRSDRKDCKGITIRIYTTDYEIEIDVFGKEEVERYKDFNILSLDSVIDVLRECYEESDDLTGFLYNIEDNFIADHIMITY